MTGTLTLEEQLVHSYADYESLRASTLKEVRWIARDLEQAQHGLARPDVSEDKRLFLAQYMNDRLDALNDVIRKLEAARK